MKRFNEKAERIWHNRVISELQKIQVESGECRFNFRCSYNTVHDAIKNKDSKIALVMYVHENSKIILHCVNYHKGKFIDNTLGTWATTYDYYFLRWIEKDEFNNKALDIFDATRKEWCRMIPLYYRWLVDTAI